MSIIRQYQWVAVAAFISIIFLLLEYFHRPYYYFDTDIEPDYLISSLFYLNGEAAWSFHHPGILVQKLGGLMSFFFELNLIDEAEKFLTAAKSLSVLINLVLLTYVCRKNWSFSINLGVIFPLFFLWPPTIHYLDYFGSDAYIASFSLVYALNVLESLTDSDSNKMTNSSSKGLILISVLSAVLLTLKLSTLPLVVLGTAALTFKFFREEVRKIDSIKNTLILVSTILFSLIIICLGIIDRLPSLLYRTLLREETRLQFTLQNFAIVILICSVLMSSIYSKIRTATPLLFTQPAFLFLLIGNLLFLILLFSLEDLNSVYSSGVTFRNLSPFFIIFIITLGLIFKSSLRSPIVPLLLSICIIGTTLHFASRNSLIEERKEKETTVLEIFRKNNSQGFKNIFWFGSGDNNFLEEGFYYWANYRYAAENYSHLLNKKYDNEMLRLRNLFYEEKIDKDISFLNKLFPFKAKWPYGSNLFTSAPAEKVSILIKESEVYENTKLNKGDRLRFLKRLEKHYQIDDVEEIVIDDSEKYLNIKLIQK